MDEFKHIPSFVKKSLKQGLPSLSELFTFSVANFSSVPRFLTLAMHVDLSETTSLHCVRSGVGTVADFQVPKQPLLLKMSKEGVRFNAVRVMGSNGVMRWLIAPLGDKRGFLVPIHVLNVYGNQVSSRRSRHLRSSKIS